MRTTMRMGLVSPLVIVIFSIAAAEIEWMLTEPAWKGKMFIEDPINDASQMGMLVTIVTHSKELAAAYKDKYGKDPVLDADTPDAGWLWLKMFAKNKPVPEPGGDEQLAAFAAPKMKDSYLGINTGYSKYSDVLKGKLAFEPCTHPFVNGDLFVRYRCIDLIA